MKKEHNTSNIDLGPIIAIISVDPPNARSFQDNQNTSPIDDEEDVEENDELLEISPDPDDYQDDEAIDDLDDEETDVDEDEGSALDIDEIIPDNDNIDRDPVVQPGTDPMKTDNSQII